MADEPGESCETCFPADETGTDFTYCDTIGIDLGTTRSSVAVWDGTKVHVIPNESGENTTPSWVTYLSKTSRRVGKASERAAGKYLSGTIYHSKRLIGRPFCPSLEEEKNALRWPFDVVDSDGSAAIQIVVDGEEKVVSPEEVGAAILAYLKKVAEDFIGRPVCKAVITVPAYFSDSQRQATRDAGLIAGLEVRRILNEPTAAALAFGVLDPLVQTNRKESALQDLLHPISLDDGTAREALPDATEPQGEGGGEQTAEGNGKGGEGEVEVAAGEGRGGKGEGGEEEEEEKGRNMLVFDFGGGTLDVTIMHIHQMAFKVRATDGDMALGGEDMDAAIVTHLVKVFACKSGVDLQALPDKNKRNKALKKLRDAASTLKIDLSRLSKSELCIDDLVEGEALEMTMERSELEDIIAPLLDKLKAPVDRALDKVHGGMDPRDIDQVLLVGGSSRIPRVQEMLQEWFAGAEICRRINPDEAIVIGAAIEASRTHDMEDVVPRALCIATANHKDRSRSFATPVIPASTPIPPEGIAYTECFANSRDDQTCITLRLCEGEADFFDDNLKLGVFEISDIPPRPRGQVTIKVTLKVDTNGILSVHAKVDQTGQELDMTVTSNKGRMSQEMLEAKKAEETRYHQVVAE